MCDEWSTLRRLGKEREVVGLYLSSHPLDDYKSIIDQMCNATLTDLNHLEDHVGQELAVACVTVSGEERTTADGKSQYGILGVEDYSDKYDFWLRRKDFERFRNFLHPDYYLLIRGEVRQFTTFDKNDVQKLNPITRNYFNITSMTQLNEVVEGLKQITIWLDVSSLTSDFVAELSEVLKHSKGKTSFHISIYDPLEGVSVNMHTKKRRVTFTDELRQFFEHNNIKYTLM